MHTQYALTSLSRSTILHPSFSLFLHVSCQSRDTSILLYTRSTQHVTTISYAKMNGLDNVSCSVVTWQAKLNLGLSWDIPVRSLLIPATLEGDVECGSYLRSFEQLYSPLNGRGTI